MTNHHKSVQQQDIIKLEAIMSEVSFEQYYIDSGLHHTINTDKVLLAIFSAVKNNSILLAGYANAMQKSHIHTYSAVKTALDQAHQISPQDDNVAYDLAQLGIITNLKKAGLNANYIIATHSNISMIYTSDIIKFINNVIAYVHNYMSLQRA